MSIERFTVFGQKCTGTKALRQEGGTEGTILETIHGIEHCLAKE